MPLNVRWLNKQNKKDILKTRQLAAMDAHRKVILSWLCQRTGISRQVYYQGYKAGRIPSPGGLMKQIIGQIISGQVLIAHY